MGGTRKAKTRSAPNPTAKSQGPGGEPPTNPSTLKLETAQEVTHP